MIDETHQIRSDQGGNRSTGKGRSKSAMRRREKGGLEKERKKEAAAAAAALAKQFYKWKKKKKPVTNDAIAKGNRERTQQRNATARTDRK